VDGRLFCFSPSGGCCFEKYNEWYHVKTNDEQIGWQHGKYLRVSEDQEEDDTGDEEDNSLYDQNVLDSSVE